VRQPHARATRSSSGCRGRAWAVPGDRFYDPNFEVVGWTARKSDHADYVIVSVSTGDAREGRLGVP
jgi:hypothetical protein